MRPHTKQQQQPMDDQFAEWHAVRPWLPALSLTVLEITSVSVTFILASPYSAPDAARDASLAALGLVAGRTRTTHHEDHAAAAAAANGPHGQVVSDILAKGLSVKVNGTPWQRVILKMDDVLDEAIIILYGLMPARQYDVELGILPDEASLRGQITTDTEVRTGTVLPDTLPDEPAASTPEAPSAPHGSSPASASAPAPAATPTLEERRQQLVHALALLTAEHGQLAAALKTARRESQKADAALRAEIDALRRAADRHAAGEGRARKKVLALQEAAKQTLAAARELEALVEDIEAARPALEKKREALEREEVRVREEAARVRQRKEEAEMREKARAEAAQGELAAAVNRLEKLNAKREKLEGEGGVLAELEERLRKLEEERERIEKDPYGYEGEGEDGERDESRDGTADGERAHHAHGGAHGGHHDPHSNHTHPHNRKRHSHPNGQHHHGYHPHVHQPHHPRPSFPPVRAHQHTHQEPIQRPGARTVPFTAHPHPQPHVNQAQVPGVINLQSQAQVQPQTQAHQHQHYPAQAQKVRPHVRGNVFRQGSSSSSSSSTPIGSLTPASTLSGRAPPFEPGSGGRARSHSQSQQQPQPPGVVGGNLKSDLNPGSTPFSPRTVGNVHTRTATSS
ncbi:uncharacterized protein BXZ73DRAFT_98397 [Epithele typhae]|uniref:uncharacterized protein n=1 Tax=Epithele typhae TaxID=378194 RepID=UPI002007DE59|nr:uncharacterized protein BXZ73DRAFT_98397 [Epithele typhae]KAH9941184.1 hypothetical protein BXZ73DRAFT_98397 [Epithele typhae]